MEGPVAAQVQAVFLDDCTKITGNVLHGSDHFPALSPAGPVRAQMLSSSPSGGSENMLPMCLMAITAATASIDLSAAYFVPDALTLQALIDARRRGVLERIVEPGAHIDSDTARGASRATRGAMPEAGATIAAYRPTMYRCKVLIIDGLLTSVGSTNFDNRSSRLNDEANLNVFDRDSVAQQTAAFKADLAEADPVSFAKWKARPPGECTTDWMASLFGSQLFACGEANGRRTIQER